jgi:hypothetical protein
MISLSHLKELSSFSLLALLASCATVLNQPLQKLTVIADKNIKVISVDKAAMTDSSTGYNYGTVKYYVKRSSQPLLIKLQIDSSIKTVALKAQKSFAYWYNILSNYGIGMLVDKNNLKRYAYPRYNYFTIKDSSIKIHRFAQQKKGTLNVSFSLPVVTGFSLNDSNGKYNSAGIFGIEAGLEYFHKQDQYFSLNIGAATDVFGEHIGTGYFESGHTFFTSLRSNHIAGRFELGYGISLSKFKWQKNYSDSVTSTTQFKGSVAAGLSFAAQYKIGQYFRCGVLYQPGIFNTTYKPVLDYQHYLSLNLIWKLRVKKG